MYRFYMLTYLTCLLYYDSIKYVFINFLVKNGFYLIEFQAKANFQLSTVRLLIYTVRRYFPKSKNWVELVSEVLSFF